MTTQELQDTIRKLTDTGDIDVVGFADASPFKGYTWKKYKRRAPSLSMSEAKSIIVAGIYIGGVKLPAWDNPWYGRTSRLYLSGYFLDAVEPMQPIAALLRDAGYQALVCDESNAESSILPLKLGAIRAGLGWQGKHSLLISKKFGTFLALGGIITDAEFEINTPEERNRCRECDQCQKACPVGALEKPYILNLKKCMSYRLQVDNLPERIQAVMQNRVADCEICQDACPWNTKHIKRPLQSRLTKSFQKDIEAWESLFHLPELINLTEKEYSKRLGHLNTDIPYAYFHRNVEIALDHIKKSEENVKIQGV